MKFLDYLRWIFRALWMQRMRSALTIVGFAIGIAAHGIGTARAFQVNQVAGTFAGIGMGLNGLITAILVPLLLFLL